ncbi:MAG: GWxTD domain-containing protein [Gemmatimonadota bacterium]|nr:MAG: GWxTD domain-containing protein [Gemmatimonadota bacterium]
MTPLEARSSCRKGHPCGGLFVACLALAACGPSASVHPDISASPVPESDRLPNPLGVYEQLGHLVGDRRFAAVGKFAYLPGPADSTYAVLALSLPNSALRFRREPPDFLARYRVAVVVGDSAAPAAQLSELEEVRVRTFRETSRRDESVVFQALLTLVPGEYPAEIDVRDLGSSAGFSGATDLRVPRFGPASISAPIVVYRARARPTRESPPSLILNPRATIELSGAESRVHLETLSDSDSLAILEARQDGQVLWTDTLALRPGEGRLRTAATPLDPERLPPGAVSLHARLAGKMTGDSTTVVVALLPDWPFVSYAEAMSHLRYAGTPDEIEALSNVPPEERAQQLHAFWKRKDPVPETSENEFFEEYFRRLQEANDRFSDGVNAGWLTDRGAVYVTLGPPDGVRGSLDARQGQERSQIWLYHKSLGFELRLVFVDQGGLGVLVLTAESRQAFHEAARTIRS